jgi:hypothetical protein
MFNLSKTELREFQKKARKLAKKHCTCYKRDLHKYCSTCVKVYTIFLSQVHEQKERKGENNLGSSSVITKSIEFPNGLSHKINVIETNYGQAAPEFDTSDTIKSLAMQLYQLLQDFFSLM